MVASLKTAVRSLTRRPLLVSLAVIALALGIGANTAIFSIVNAVLLRPLPFHDSDRLVLLWSTGSRGASDRGPVSYLDFRDWKEQSAAFDGMAMVWTFPNGDVNLTGGREPERVSVARISTGFFEMLGVAPLLGRTFREEESVAGNHRRAILSYGMWQRNFAGDSGLVGRTVLVNGFPYEVVGIMPRELQSRGVKLLGTDVQLWRPLVPADGQTGGRGSRRMRVVARLKSSVTQVSASADLAAIATRLAEIHPETNRAVGTTLVPLREDLVRDSRRALVFLLAAVAAVLVGACANVASLLLIRSAGSRAETAMRRALGATRMQLCAPIFAESLLLGLVGAAVGVGLAIAIVKAAVSYGPQDIPLLADARVDGFVLAFTTVVTLLAVMLVGLLPALRAAGTRATELVRQSGTSRVRGHRRALGALTIAQIAIAMVLLTAGGLMVRSFQALMQVDPGIHTGGGVTFQIELPMGSGMPYEKQLPRDIFFSSLLDRLERLPGVVSATLASAPPLEEEPPEFTFARADREDEQLRANMRLVGPDYFATLRIPIVAGRPFEATDARDAPRVSIVSTTLARAVWGTNNPVGQRLRLPFGDSDVQVVGIAGDVRARGLDFAPTPILYVPVAQGGFNFMTVVLTTVGNPIAIVPQIRRVVRDLDPNLPVHQVRTLSALVRQSVAHQQFQALLVGSFSLIVLILVVIGTYGVAAYGVTERSNELGVRMAIGATAADIRRLVMTEGIRLAAAGIVIGGLTAALLMAALRRQVVQVAAPDALAIVATPLLLGAAVIAATWIPARRAGRLDPIRVLRGDQGGDR